MLLCRVFTVFIQKQHFTRKGHTIATTQGSYVFFVPVNQNVAKLFLYLLGYEAGVGDRGERVGDGDEGEQVVGRDRVRQFPVTQSWNNIKI